MSSVPIPLASRSRRGRKAPESPAGGARWPIVSLLVCALALASCGGSSDSGRPPTESSSPAFLRGASIGSATCADWNRADAEARLATIERIRDFAGGEVSGGQGVRGRGAILEDERAYDLFDRYCEQQVARHFLLYKLYTHAAAFAGAPPG